MPVEFDPDVTREDRELRVQSPRGLPGRVYRGDTPATANRTHGSRPAIRADNWGGTPNTEQVRATQLG
jgi:hypothetical protein